METKKILKEQTHVRVVLNGGGLVLDDATIPFQIAFDENVASEKPTHILVLDVTDSSIFDSAWGDCRSERILFEIEPIQYLQLKKPGVHNLIFILLKDLDKSDIGEILEKNRSHYENPVFGQRIMKNQFCWGTYVGQVEAIVDVPSEFFAEKPESGFKKLVWKWVNSWYDFDPVDECDYRKRKIWAFTLKPVLWLLGFFARLIVSLSISVSMLTIRSLAFFFGHQSLSFLPNKKDLFINFLFLYPQNDLGWALNYDTWFDNHANKAGTYPYKVIAIGAKRFHLPVALWEIVSYAFVFLFYGSIFLFYFQNENTDLATALKLLVLGLLASLCISFLLLSTITTLKGDLMWKEKWWGSNKSENAKKPESAIKLMVYSFLAFFSPIILLSIFVLIQKTEVFPLEFLWVIGLFVLSIFVPIFFKSLFLKAKERIIETKLRVVEQKENQKQKEKEDKYFDWLKQSFSVESLPERVDIKKMPEPQTYVHKFVIRFWWLKAKVCKPFVK